jgi:hypothetical protein
MQSEFNAKAQSKYSETRTKALGSLRSPTHDSQSRVQRVSSPCAFAALRLCVGSSLFSVEPQ